MTRQSFFRRSRLSEIRIFLLPVLLLVFSGGTLGAEQGRLLWEDAYSGVIEFASVQQAEEFLRTAKVLEVEEIETGITNPKKLLLEKDGKRIHAIFRNVDVFKHFFKSRKGLKLDFHDYCVYECAAYRLSNLLGIFRVPPVVRRTFKRDDFKNRSHYNKIGDSHEGTVQAWVERSMTELDRFKQQIHPPDYKQWVNEHQILRLFDSLIWNDDRNPGNMLIGPDWKIWLIDSTRAFRPYDEPLEPEKVKRIDRRVWKRLKDLRKETLEAELGDLLRPGVLESLIERHSKLVKHIEDKITELGEEAVLADFDL